MRLPNYRTKCHAHRDDKKESKKNPPTSFNEWYEDDHMVSEPPPKEAMEIISNYLFGDYDEH